MEVQHLIRDCAMAAYEMFPDPKNDASADEQLKWYEKSLRGARIYISGLLTAMALSGNVPVESIKKLLEEK